uniref:Exo-alpha-bergamotene synthase n=1 Tax=Lavandula angustifolia TaxID=39329 RepID=LABER_LAVAN|nr:RecName: Full=Exo-alpha-bergamotene synthase; Short=LaBERS; AltName: Full=Trans-alpha-bergamotene synthase [Lavandula angustifolia]ABB73046.1 trans-alpha-bergamotene synthase [Lavandula angustifolia]
MEARRSGNFESSIWDDDYIQSLTSSYTGKMYVDKSEKLKIEVKMMMDEATDELEQLELINDLQRLGISYHFKDGIAKMLNNIYKSDSKYMEKDLHLTALKFRLLRQHGYRVPQDVFSSFMDDEGNFEAWVVEDVSVLVSLYEASHISVEGESILDMAKDFSSHHLTEMVEQIGEACLAEQVKRTLELPLHWRVGRLEARWFVQAYETRPNSNPTLVELAKLDFNMVQAKYQDELKRCSRWYEETGLPEKMSFARHRLAECFLWSLGFIPDPHHGYSREIMTKIAVLITITDDIYDIYGALEELQEFTEAFERWDINSLDLLPEYMQICFLAIFNSANELGYQILRDQGLNIIPNLKRSWAELSRAYYLEARWFHNGFVPTTDQYLNTAWISISGPLLLSYGYLTTTNPINNKELKSLEKHPSIIRWPSMVLRLADDLGTSSEEIKRGDVSKSIQCYMNETGCCEGDARHHVKSLIEVALKRMNDEILMEKPFKSFDTNAMNLARISLCFYQYGDGFGKPHSDTIKNLVSLIVLPFHMP